VSGCCGGGCGGSSLDRILVLEGPPGPAVDGVRLEGSSLIFSVGGVDLPGVDISGVCGGTVVPPVVSDEWLVGVGAPPSSLGGPGRVYLDSVSGDVFLNGAPSRWFFGDGAPPGVVAGAKPGSGYLDVRSGDFYEMGA